MPVLVPDEDAILLHDAPLISVIVPAHNEEAVIGECLRSVLGQDYPRFELIVVDDRSSDDTAARASALISGRPNCKLVSVETLPAGWTGKCHALTVATEHAQGEWLAFLDADSVLHPNALTRCYRAALETDVGMVTLSPSFVMRSFWEKALQPAFAAMACIIHPPGKVNDPDSPVASANGMFYLINRHAYDEIGAHESVRDLAVEDIGIGKRVKAMGLGLLFANGNRLLRTRMYTNYREILRGWARILGAAMNYELTAVVRFLFMHILVSLPAMAVALYFFVPEAARMWPTWWPLLPAVCIAEMCLVPPLYCLQTGIPPRYAGLLVLGNLALVWVFLVIVKRIVRRDALQWKGTTYPESRHQPTQLEPQTPRS
jgi:chlorobactene glucosyltransferase